MRCREEDCNGVVSPSGSYEPHVITDDLVVLYSECDKCSEGYLLEYNFADMRYDRI